MIPTGEGRAWFQRDDAEPGRDCDMEPRGAVEGLIAPPTARPGCPGMQGPGHQSSPGSNPLPTPAALGDAPQPCPPSP